MAGLIYSLSARPQWWPAPLLSPRGPGVHGSPRPVARRYAPVLCDNQTTSPPVSTAHFHFPQVLFSFTPTYTHGVPRPSRSFAARPNYHVPFSSCSRCCVISLARRLFFTHDPGGHIRSGPITAACLLPFSNRVTCVNRPFPCLPSRLTRQSSRPAATASIKLLQLPAAALVHPTPPWFCVTQALERPE